jgi:heme-degrading monooxygenase HmoA
MGLRLPGTVSQEQWGHPTSSGCGNPHIGRGGGRGETFRTLGMQFRERREGFLIARIWRGAVRQADGDAYARYMKATGVRGYADTPGNRGVWMLRRDVADRTEFVMVTVWDSLQAIKAFAGDDYETAVFYPEDERFLVRRDDKAAHYEVD